MRYKLLAMSTLAATIMVGCTTDQKIERSS